MLNFNEFLRIQTNRKSIYLYLHRNYEIKNGKFHSTGNSQMMSTKLVINDEITQAFWVEIIAYLQICIDLTGGIKYFNSKDNFEKGFSYDDIPRIEQVMEKWRKNNE